MNKIKAVTLVIIILLACCSCTSVKTRDNSWDEYNLNSEVKSIISNYYSVEGTSTELSSTLIENFSNDGMLQNKTRKDENGEIYDQVEILYSDNYKRIKTTFTDDDLHGCASIEVKYNDDATRVEAKFLDRKEKLIQRTITERNKNGSMSKYSFYNSNNELTNMNQYFYEDYKLTKIVREDLKNGHKTSYSISNDENGNIIKEYGVDERGNNSHTISREFDQQNNLLFEITDFDGYDGFYYRHEYEYDKCGNWIKRIDYGRDSKIKTIVERKIEYYNF